MDTYIDESANAPQEAPEASWEALDEDPAAVDAPTSADLSATDFLTPAAARKAREQRQRGYLFPLTHTGGKAHVRKLTLADRSVIGSIDPLIQRKLLQAIAEFNKQKQTVDQNGSVNMGAALGYISRTENMMNMTCVAGFIRPRLILSESQRTSDDEVLVTDIDILDRSAYFRAVEGDERILRQFAPFPDGAD